MNSSGVDLQRHRSRARKLSQNSKFSILDYFMGRMKKEQQGEDGVERARTKGEEPTDFHHSPSGSSNTDGNAPFESQQSDQPLVNGKGKSPAEIPEGMRQRTRTDNVSNLDVDLEAGRREPEKKEKKEKEDKAQGWFRTVHPREPFTVGNQIQRVFLGQWVNILLLFIPVGFAVNYVKSVDRVIVFIMNFIAIVPLASLLGFATEEIALRTGEVIGGFLNATFGNAVELIVAILALAEGQVVIVQTSLIGSVLSNLLLVLGFCFFLGGLRRTEQHFNHTVAQTAAALLALAVGSLIVPTVFETTGHTDSSDIAGLSRGTSVIMLIVYLSFLFFQLKTHSDVFQMESQKVPAKPWRENHVKDGAIKQAFAVGGAGAGILGLPKNEESREKFHERTLNPDLVDDEEEPQLHIIVAVLLLLFSTVLVAFCAEFMVSSIDSITETHDGSQPPLSKEFVGLILLPIVGNAAEHVTAVTVAIKDKMDLAIGVAVGSSMQVAMFLIPLLVIIGWGMGNEEMNLSFDVFQVTVLFVAVLLTNYLISDGKSHWLEGLQLICLYFIIAVCAFYYKDEGSTSSSGEGSSSTTSATVASTTEAAARLLRLR